MVSVFQRMLAAQSRFAEDESGATAIEYAIIASGIGVTIAAVVFSLGTTLNTFFGTISFDNPAGGGEGGE